MALSTARMHKVRGRPPRLAAGISSLSHSHSSSVRSLGYVFSFIFSFYTTHEDFSDRLLEQKTGKGSRDDSKVPDNLQDIHVRMDAMYASGNAGTLPLKMGGMSHFGVVLKK